MASSTNSPPIGLSACDCLTPFGNKQATFDALIAGQIALKATPVLGRDGGDPVPLALMPGRGLDETTPPAWLEPVRRLATRIPGGDWGTPKRPVIVTSSNFGVGNLLAFRRWNETDQLRYGVVFRCVEEIQRTLGWGPNTTTFSHACVSAHLGLLHASRLLESGMADEALVFSFDFLSPFVAGGFHSLKILNESFPAPYQDRESGAIGLGDGAAFAVLGRAPSEFVIEGQSLFNELHHFTANKPDGSGFSACLDPLSRNSAGLRVWCKGHGTGTLEAGRLEVAAIGAAFPDAPLVGWKGSLGHTLGSCGLVELAVASESIRHGRAPGTVNTARPTFSDIVAIDPLPVAEFDGVVCASNAFGGAHAALILRHG